MVTKRAIKPVTASLGEMTHRAQAHVMSGRYGSVSEVLRAGLRALDREEAALDDLIREKIAEALADPRPSLTSEAVFDGLKARHEERLKREA